MALIQPGMDTCLAYVVCRVCGWEGKATYAKIRPDDLVRCPQCNPEIGLSPPVHVFNPLDQTQHDLLT